MRPPSDDAAVLTSAKYAVYGLLGSSAVLLVLSWGADLLATFGRGQVSSDGPAHRLGHMLARLAGGLAMSTIAIVLLSIAYWASSVIRPPGYSLDDGRKGVGMTRFAIEVGFVIGAGALALVMCENTRHGLVGILAVGAALTHGVFRSVEFLGAERLTRPARFALRRVTRGRLRLLAPKTANADATGEALSYADHMRGYHAGELAGKPTRAESAPRVPHDAEAAVNPVADTARQPAEDVHADGMTPKEHGADDPAADRVLDRVRSSAVRRRRGDVHSPVMLDVSTSGRPRHPRPRRRRGC